MIGWGARRVAEASGARLVDPGPAREGPRRVVIDSREVGDGDLFVGLPGASTDGGAFAQGALAAGAWGVLVAPKHAERLGAGAAGAILTHESPLAGLQALAQSWRRELGARVVAITGSTGKTSTKDILGALLASHMATVASPQNLNTEIGLPLAVLAAPPGSRALVLEMGMRGPGQIAELTEIAQPDVGVIVSVGPVHLELLGSMAAIAAAKAELIAGLGTSGVAVLPADEPLLEGHRRPELRTLTFGPGGDVQLVEQGSDGELVIAHGGDRMRLRPSFDQPHNLRNLLAAVAAARALGVTPEGDVQVAFSAGRGERVELPTGVVLLNDCYNANPMSMRAALDELARTAPGRRVAVLGDMLELGPDEAAFHREVGAHAQGVGVDVLITVGPRAAHMAETFSGPTRTVDDAPAAVAALGGLLRPGDTVLVKASNGVGLRLVADELTAPDAVPAGAGDRDGGT